MTAKHTGPGSSSRTDLFNGLFHWYTHDGQARVLLHDASPAVVPCPTTGHPLRVATIDATARAICPACAQHGVGGFVSFVADLRIAYACPACCQLIWLAGA